ncbi:hypothetical protein IW150_004328, partial [Coemansia sp. RSA 2607]
MATSTTVADCSAQRYCTQPGVSLGYSNQFVVHWNNQYPPLNPESLVTVSVYSAYDLSSPIYQQTGIDNTNGAVTLKPDASWFSRYTGNNDASGENQQIYFAAYLQGNDPPPVSDMLSLQMTATPQQYTEIQRILHPELFATTPTTSSSSSTLSSSTSTESSTTQPSSSSLSKTASASVSTATTTVTHTPTPTVAEAHTRSGLSAGAIAGIAVAGAIGLLLLLFIVFFPIYRRRQRQRRMLSKSAEMAAASSPSPDTPPTGETAALAATGAGAAALAAANEKHPRTSSPTDTPLLVGGKPNNSFTSHDGSLADSHMSPSTVYQPLSLESPRILMNMPSSTRSASAIAGRPDDHVPPPLAGRS